MQIIDAHCHLHAYKTSELRRFMGIRISAVSEDYSSSLETLSIRERMESVEAFVGLHPWEIDSGYSREVRLIAELVSSRVVSGIGEVGLDKRYSKATMERQIEVYREFCSIASEMDLPMNVHALGSWSEAVSIATRMGVRSVLLHWYNGPSELLKEIEGMGYFISINPAIQIQEKHRKIMESADLSTLLTESDGPYNYRGLQLDPSMIIDIIRLISESKGMEIEETATILANNYERHLHGIQK